MRNNQERSRFRASVCRVLGKFVKEYAANGIAISHSHAGPNKVGSAFEATKLAASPKASQFRKTAEICAFEEEIAEVCMTGCRLGCRPSLQLRCRKK